MELTFALPLSPAFALLLVRVFLSLLSFCPSLLLLSLTHSLSRARSLGCDAASCSCRCWPCAALARLCLARTYPVPPSSPSRFSFAPISLSSRQALVAPRHQAAPLPLGCSLLLVEHHHHCTCHTFAINQSINQSSGKDFDASLSLMNVFSWSQGDSLSSSSSGSVRSEAIPGMMMVMLVTQLRYARISARLL